MAGERELNFGADETDARWQITDEGDGGNLVLARDLDNNTVLLEYDETAGEWVSRGPVNMSGGDISNVGTVTADAVETEELVTKNAPTVSEVARDTASGSISDPFTLTLPYANNGEYLIQINPNSNGRLSNSSLELTVTGVGAGEYAYWDETGTEQPSEDAVLLADLRIDTRISGFIDLTIDNRLNLFNRLRFGQAGAGGFSQRGRSSSVVNSSGSVTITGDLREDITAVLFEVTDE